MEEKAKRLELAVRHLLGSGIIKSQKDIAQAMGANKVSVSSALSGNKTYLTDSFVNRFNKAFGSIFNSEWIITGNGSMIKDHTDEVIQGDTIKERLLTIADLYFEGNKASFARAIGITPTSLGNYIGDKECQPPSGVLEAIIKSLSDLNPEWLLTGIGGINKPKIDIMNYDEIEPEYVYLLPISAHAGRLCDFVVSIKDSDCEKIISPIKGADYAINVSGDSMSPEYPSGSQILIKRINDQAFINWGSTFVLDTCNGVIVKKLYPVSDDPNSVLCESINPKYPPFTVLRSDIYGIYKVMLCMSIK